MAGIQRRDYRDKELPGLFRTLGTQLAVAKAIGVPRKSLLDYIGRAGNEELKAKVDAAADEHFRVDVRTPEGREGLNRDAEIAHLKKENKSLTKLLLDQEHLVDRLIALTEEPRENPSFSVTKSETKAERDAILPLYDLQFGQRVTAEDTPGGMNTFNVEVFTERLARYVEAVGNTLLDYGQSHSIKNLIIPFGGDAVEGWGVFKAQEWQLELDPIEQVIRLVDLMVPALHEIIGLAKEELGVEGVGVFCVTGNHGKPGGRSSGALPSTLNFDYLFYRMLEKAMVNYPIDQWGIEPAGSLYFVSQGHTFLMIHGHEVRGWGGLPLYGLTKWDAKAIRLNHQMFSYALLGHHHVPANISIGYGEHLMSGNWVGANNLSKEITAGGRPSQWVFFTSKEYGVGERSLIHLDKNAEPKKPEVYSVK